jgi:ferredoxin-NADP reductase
LPKLRVALANKEEIADGTYAFTLDLKGQPFAYKPGQTIDLTYADMPKSDAAGNKRTFSIASAPGKGTLLVATRDRGSAFKRSLIEAPMGVELDLEGPFGSFTLPNKATTAVLLAGGIGVTPFRAMAQDPIERSLDHTLTLIHSNRTPEEAPFLLELLNWATNNDARFRYTPTMTKPERSKKPWKGERRRVDPASLREWLPKGGASVHYVAGPEGFVKGAAEALRAAGVDEDQIRTEEFPGY